MAGITSKMSMEKKTHSMQANKHVYSVNLNHKYDSIVIQLHIHIDIQIYVSNSMCIYIYRYPIIYIYTCITNFQSTGNLGL